MKSKKIIALVLALVVLLSMALVGCGKKPSEDGINKVLDYYVSAEPETIDPHQVWSSSGIFFDNMFMEGLTRLGKEEGEVIPGMATSWEYHEDTNSYTFELRDGIKWSNGDPVTAEDFFFGWRYALDVNSVYSFLITDYIAGAADYAAYDKSTYLSEVDPSFNGLSDEEKAKRIDEMTEEELQGYKAKKDELWSKVGISTKNNGKTIEVKLALPAPFFPSLMAFPTFYPANEKFYNEHKDNYMLEAETTLANGPWKLVEWKHDDSLKLVRNEHYWNTDNINIDEINTRIITEVETRTNLLKTGELDGSAIQSKDLPDFQDLATLDSLNLQKLTDMPDYAVFYYEFNHFNNPITKNANIRKAMAYAMDREGMVENINLGDIPAYAFIPTHFPGLNKSFREENGEKLFEADLEKAKEFLQKGLEELGLDELPPLDVLVDEGEIGRKIGQKYQADWARIGIKVNIIEVPWAEKLNRLRNGDFAVCGSGWGPDYLDPMTYLDIFTTGNGSNSGQYSNPKYDELIANAKKETDAKKRMEYLYEAEKLLIDDMVIVPSYYRMAHWTFKKYVKGVVHRGSGANTDFYWADIDMNAKNAQKK